jgi:hypothetical protein
MAQDQQVKGQKAEGKRETAQEQNREVDQRMEEGREKDRGGDDKTQPST